MRRAQLALVLALLLTGCNGNGGGTGSDPNAPIIDNLRPGVPNFTPRVGQVTPQVFAVDYTDRGDDIGQGGCELTVGVQTAITQLGFADGSTLSAGTVACLWLGIYRGTEQLVRVTLIDGSGRRSNTLTIVAVAEGRGR
jgi:hypothetical protein